MCASKMGGMERAQERGGKREREGKGEQYFTPGTAKLIHNFSMAQQANRKHSITKRGIKRLTGGRGGAFRGAAMI